LFRFSEKLKAIEREQGELDVQDLHPCFTIASKAKQQFRKAQENYASLPNEPRYSHLAGDTPAILGEVHTYMLIIQLMVRTKSFRSKKTKEILLKFLQEPTDKHLQKVHYKYVTNNLLFPKQVVRSRNLSSTIQID
jgi:hypothetical protein